MGRLGFTVGQVAILTGLTPKQLTYLAQSGLYTPAVQIGHGKGSRRLYSFRDVVTLRMVAKLRKSGVGGVVLQRAISFLQQAPAESASGWLLVIRGEEVRWVPPEVPLDTLLKGSGQLLLVFDIGKIAREVEEAIRAAG